MKNASWTLCIVCWTFEVTRMHKDRQICCSATVMFPTLKPLVRPETSVKSAGSLNPVHFHVWLDNIITENIPVCIYTQSKRSQTLRGQIGSSPGRLGKSFCGCSRGDPVCFTACMQ